MKNQILAMLLLFSSSIIYGHDANTNDQNDVISYLVRKVLLFDRKGGEIVLIPHYTEDIKRYNPSIDSKYWKILGNYFPGLSKDTLIKKVEGAPWIDKSISIENFQLRFPTIKKDERYPYTELFRKYGVPVFSVSNIVFSNDKTTCILYLGGFEAGAFTVEIKKNSAGKWASHETTADWLE